MLIKALILLSGSFFGNAEAEGIFINGYLNGVVSIAPPGVYAEEITFEQIKLLSQNSEDVSILNFITAFYGDSSEPVLKCGIAISIFDKNAWIISLYFTGVMSGFR